MLQASRPGFHIRLFASCIVRIQLRSNSVSLTRFSWRCFYKDTCNRDLQGHCSDTNWPTCLRDLISSVNIILRKKWEEIFFKQTVALMIVHVFSHTSPLMEPLEGGIDRRWNVGHWNPMRNRTLPQKETFLWRDKSLLSWYNYNN